MSGHNLSVDGELRYIIQWFNEWSELQREDFLPILVEYLTKDSPTHYVNGVVNSMANVTCDEKPMSLFQCRVSVRWKTIRCDDDHPLTTMPFQSFSLFVVFTGEIVP